MTPPRAVLSWSSGKDCAWAGHMAQQTGQAEIAALLTTTNEAFDRVAMHGTRNALLRAQAAAMDVELIEVPLPWPCSNEVYQDRMAEAVAKLAERGLNHMIFGDLFLEDVRTYREANLAGSGITPLFPLWGRDTAELALEMIDGGLEAHLVTLDPTRLPADFAGRRYDRALLAALPEGIDPCGENGEFHTAVSNCPLFKAPLHVAPGEVVTRDGFVYADLVPSI
ncbi:MJ0570-related uncharacterized domain-containing protein [Poseidonocella pacifica]|uniref:MJ0570-related uncharacterized domain-containing protein n=1 Tax=Poseidonocella pacifica TaxID=871651 RepID=A0A1I0V5H1_9RHOB|nr:ATP-binding protein [Poseidonocella pacifica]SFA71323.1 MJ0570-related uncharacterized domain-containing protein [Poseidonocella pacifica]